MLPNALLGLGIFQTVLAKPSFPFINPDESKNMAGER
jgi:hypothetical protein